MLVVDQLEKGDRQLRTLAFCLLGGIALLLAGLWKVQVLSSRRYEADLRTQSFRTVRLPAMRGKILDRNGLPLAENRPSYNVSIYLNELREYFQADFRERKLARKVKWTTAQLADMQRESRARVVSNLVQQIAAIVQYPIPFDQKRFEQHYERQLALPFSVIEGLTPQQVARFEENSMNLPGVDLEAQPLRSYPNGPATAHLVGYVERDNNSIDDDETVYNYRLTDFRGAIGEEANFDEELRGHAGAKSMLVNNLGYVQSGNNRTGSEASVPGTLTIVPPLQVNPEPGKNVVLTIDLRIQLAAAQALQSHGPETRGAAVVMDARNGDILALVSVPSYDPNLFLGRISPEEWRKLTDPKLNPTFNRATFGAYQPGSTFKIVTALAGLEAGTLDPNEIIHDPGWYQLGRRSIASTAPAGDYDFTPAFALSSNTYFIHFGLKTGLERLLDMAHRFHLGEKTGVFPRQEVTGEIPAFRDVAHLWNEGNTANVSIGQEITVTPLQMAVLTAAVANGGRIFWPRLVDRIEEQEPGGDVQVTAFPAGRVRSVIELKPKNLELVRAAMRADVEHPTIKGSGRGAAIPNFQICGKTGTAQIKRAGMITGHTTWFVSYAPYKDPRYVVVVMVEDGSSGGGT